MRVDEDDVCVSVSFHLYLCDRSDGTDSSHTSCPYLLRASVCCLHVCMCAFASVFALVCAFAALLTSLPNAFVLCDVLQEASLTPAGGE